MIARKNAEIAKYENELHLMGDPEKYPTNAEWRMRSVSSRLREAHSQLENYEWQRNDLIKFLKTAE